MATVGARHPRKDIKAKSCPLSPSINGTRLFVLDDRLVAGEAHRRTQSSYRFLQGNRLISTGNVTPSGQID
jgi:hypothetical protein